MMKQKEPEPLIKEVEENIHGVNQDEREHEDPSLYGQTPEHSLRWCYGERRTGLIRPPANLLLGR